MRLARFDRPRSIAAPLVILALLVSACGASESVSSPGVNPPNTDDASGDLFPDIAVQNVADGSTLNLQAELQGGDRPVLLWFWAPH